MDGTSWNRPHCSLFARRTLLETQTVPSEFSSCARLPSCPRGPGSLQSTLACQSERQASCLAMKAKALLEPFPPRHLGGASHGPPAWLPAPGPRQPRRPPGAGAPQGALHTAQPVGLTSTCSGKLGVTEAQCQGKAFQAIDSAQPGVRWCRHYRARGTSTFNSLKLELGSRARGGLPTRA